MDARDKVLIVEDDDAGRAMISLVLRQAGYRVVTAAGGAEALQVLDKGGCAWMVTDVKMRPMDGFALSSRAKELHPDLRIAMMSAVDGEKDAPPVLADAFFAKPVAVEELMGWLGRPSPGPSPAP